MTEVSSLFLLGLALLIIGILLDEYTGGRRG